MDESVTPMVRSAAKGSRELDCRIWCAITERLYLRIEERGSLPLPHTYVVYRRPGAKPEVETITDLSIDNPISDYTTNMQDAYSLVPSNCLFSLWQDKKKGWWAKIEPLPGGCSPKAIAGPKWGAPALVICEVALYARQKPAKEKINVN